MRILTMAWTCFRTRPSASLAPPIATPLAIAKPVGRRPLRSNLAIPDHKRSSALVEGLRRVKLINLMISSRTTSGATSVPYPIR